jgi:hypothetical protein
MAYSISPEEDHVRVYWLFGRDAILIVRCETERCSQHPSSQPIRLGPNL